MPFDLDPREACRTRLSEVRARSRAIARPLGAEDMLAQAFEDASPTKWHLAHTTWFFSEFVLKTEAPPGWRYLFNSYYEAVGARHSRNARGLITRPSVEAVLAWRSRVDEALDAFVQNAATREFAEAAPLLELGCNHEEQHQELMLTDILALFAAHPEAPAYRDDLAPIKEDSPTVKLWRKHAGGLTEIGADRDFAFDCERPRHRVWLEPFALANRLVTNGEWRDFIEDGGYCNPLLWLSDGLACVRREGWRAPGHWREVEDEWRQVTLAGLKPLASDTPVSHISFWEADAFARWSGARLPREAEWEAAASQEPIVGNLLSSDRLRPSACGPASTQMFGDVWEWTQSAFAPYPGFQAAPGVVGEYNGKFMAAQFVLRGGSCLTPNAHVRASYRNFFHPHQRWQMMGLRLAKDLA